MLERSASTHQLSELAVCPLTAWQQHLRLCAPCRRTDEFGEGMPARSAPCAVVRDMRQVGGYGGRLHLSETPLPAARGCLRRCIHASCGIADEILAQRSCAVLRTPHAAKQTCTMSSPRQGRPADAAIA